MPPRGWSAARPPPGDPAEGDVAHKIARPMVDSRACAPQTAEGERDRMRISRTIWLHAALAGAIAATGTHEVYIQRPVDASRSHLFARLSTCDERLNAQLADATALERSAAAVEETLLSNRIQTAASEIRTLAQEWTRFLTQLTTATGERPPPLVDAMRCEHMNELAITHLLEARWVSGGSEAVHSKHKLIGSPHTDYFGGVDQPQAVHPVKLRTKLLRPDTSTVRIELPRKVQIARVEIAYAPGS